MRNYFLGLCLLFALCFTACSHSDDSVDVLIIGGGASGVTAGIQSARMGAATLIVEETEWLGGMLTSAGVSAVDGNYDLPAGLFGEFREHLADYYVAGDAACGQARAECGRRDAWRTGAAPQGSYVLCACRWHEW